MVRSTLRLPHVRGDCKLVVSFDNTHSIMKSKELRYELRVVPFARRSPRNRTSRSRAPAPSPPSAGVPSETQRALWGESRRDHRPLQSDILRRFRPSPAKAPVPVKAELSNAQKPVWAREGRHSRFSVQGGIHHPTSIPGAGNIAGAPTKEKETGGNKKKKKKVVKAKKKPRPTSAR